MKNTARYEPVLFCLVIVLNLLPVLFTPVMFSLDGPAHMYNAAMLKGFVTGHSDTVYEFLYINKVPVPNWTGHLLMAFFQFFVSPAFSEKLLVISLLVLTPFSFRYFVKSFENYQVAGAYFIFAITYNAFQVLGFYNFLLAFIPAFYLLGYLVRHLGRYRRKHYLVLSLLLILTYFSHLFIYLLCLLAVALVVFFYALISAGFKPRNWFPVLLKTSLPFLLVVLPSCILLFCFYFIKPQLYPTYLETGDIIKLVRENSSLMSFRYEETTWTQPLLLVFVLLAFFSFVSRIRQFMAQKQLAITDVFPLLLLLLILLLFTLPDSDGWAGYYTLRTLLLINLFMLLWAATVVLPGWIKAGAALFMLVGHGFLIQGYYTEYQKHQPLLNACNRAGQKVGQGQSLLTLNLTGNWRYDHTGSYVGAVNRALLLENYEAGMNYFPLKWQMQGIPTPVLKNGEVPAQFISWPLQNTGKVMPIDCIFVIGNLAEQTSEPCQQINQVLQNNYELVFNEKNCHLYKIKN